MPVVIARVGYLVEFVGLFVCLFFNTISQKPMQLASANVMWKCSTMNPGNPFILGSRGQEVKVTRHKNMS